MHPPASTAPDNETRIFYFKLCVGKKKKKTSNLKHPLFCYLCFCFAGHSMAVLCYSLFSSFFFISYHLNFVCFEWKKKKESWKHSTGEDFRASHQCAQPSAILFCVGTACVLCWLCFPFSFLLFIDYFIFLRRCLETEQEAETAVEMEHMCKNKSSFASARATKQRVGPLSRQKEERRERTATPYTSLFFCRFFFQLRKTEREKEGAPEAHASKRGRRIGVRIEFERASLTSKRKEALIPFEGERPLVTPRHFFRTRTFRGSFFHILVFHLSSVLLVSFSPFLSLCVKGAVVGDLQMSALYCERMTPFGLSHLSVLEFRTAIRRSASLSPENEVWATHRTHRTCVRFRTDRVNEV